MKANRIVRIRAKRSFGREMFQGDWIWKSGLQATTDYLNFLMDFLFFYFILFSIYHFHFTCTKKALLGNRIFSLRLFLVIFFTFQVLFF